VRTDIVRPARVSARFAPPGRCNLLIPIGPYRQQVSCLIGGMAPPRLFVPGLSHHVRHRGNNRCDVFLDADDRKTFLSMMGKSAREHDVAIHGYTLMTTHYHAQVTASDEQALPRMMQSLGEYVRYFNVRHGRTGTLWEGRYRASLILDERHWFYCLRYIEANPVRAGMVTSHGEYKWSSYRCNALGSDDPLITPHPLYTELGRSVEERAAKWGAMCDEVLTERELTRIRWTVRRGQALGPERTSADPHDSLRAPVVIFDRVKGGR
jgi:putative transposase